MKLFVKDLTVIDSTYLCPDRGLVGESWLVDIELAGALNDMDMLLDFGQVKKLIKQLIDQEVDHKLLVPQRSPLCKTETLNGYTHIDFARPNGGSIQLRCPTQAFAFIDTLEVTNDALTTYVQRIILQKLPSNIQDLKVKLRHEAIDGPYYHYSHGLKKHDGNCQRIAHGHRSTLEIMVDGEQDLDLATSWAMKWRNIYLASKADQIEPSNISFYQAQNWQKHYAFAYQSPQGFFELVLPQHETDILPCETTVENLAAYIASTLSAAMPEHSIEVIAYEGVGKGAISEVHGSSW
ncbi:MULTISPECIES: 6-carboxytetrahydropterin synthase [unclassified Agarivorans]|uniref:6-carboxytetrahydropterin synthase n=1 Tax=unclassified Agarivorans TaxID=2636026 RepID=UPI003D7E288D